MMIYIDPGLLEDHPDLRKYVSRQLRSLGGGITAELIIPDDDTIIDREPLLSHASEDFDFDLVEESLPANWS